MLSRLAFLLIVLLPCAARAQTLLRWKLNAGDSFNIETNQETQSQVAFSGKSVATAIDLLLDQTWTVISASEKEFVIKQTIDRIQIKLAGQQGKAEYDSSSKSKPSGHARDLADSLQPLIGAQFELTMTPRGQITAAKPANDAARALLAAKDGPADARSPSLSSLQQLLQQSLIIFPESEIGASNEWAISNELKTAAGTLKQETTYVVSGKTERGNQELLVIATQSELPRQPPIKTHQQTGDVLFSAKEGRLVEAEQTQQLTTERPYRETTIVVTLRSKQKTTMTRSNSINAN